MLECTQIICKVNDLEKAVADYQSLGFAVEWGSQPQQANNAFIWFEQGPVIELFQVPKIVSYLRFPIGLIMGQQIKNRFMYWHHCAQGICSLTLGPTKKDAHFNLKERVIALKQAGFDLSRVIHGSRKNINQQKVKYQFAVPKSTGLPLIASLYDPPQIPDQIHHPNGAKAIEWIKVAVAKTDWEHFQFLTKNEPKILLEPAETTRVIGVGLRGLNTTLDNNRLHGAHIEVVI